MIFFLLLFSLLIRLVGINQSLWLDEAISANISKLPLNQIINNFSIYDFHPPLYYWFLRLWVQIFGNEVIVMRLISVFFSIITIWLVYLIGKEIKNKEYGFWSALFVSINPLFVYYSQELRMYSMTVMWLTGAVYFWIKIISSTGLGDKISWKNIFGFNLMTFLAFTTFYGSIFMVGAMMLYLLFIKKIKLFFGTSVGIIMAMLTLSPLLITQLKNSGEMLNQVINWNLVLGKVNLKNLILIPFKFSVGRISWYPKNMYYLIGGIWTLIIWGIAGRKSLLDKRLGWLIISPIIFGVLFSIKSPLLQYFRFLYLIPILSLLLGKIDSQKIKFFLSVIFVGFSLMYLLNQNMYREDWKGLTEYLRNNQKIYMIASFADPIRFYNPTIQVGDIKTSSPDEDNIILIPYGESIHGVDTNKKMKDLGYEKTETKNYREVVMEFWERR